MELIGKSDQVNVPDRAISQIQHMIILSSNIKEKDNVKIF